MKQFVDYINEKANFLVKKHVQQQKQDTSIGQQKANGIGIDMTFDEFLQTPENLPKSVMSQLKWYLKGDKRSAFSKGCTLFFNGFTCLHVFRYVDAHYITYSFLYQDDVHDMNNVDWPNEEQWKECVRTDDRNLQWQYWDDRDSQENLFKGFITFVDGYKKEIKNTADLF